MRTMTSAALAVLIATASTAAFAQTQGTTPDTQTQAPKKKACKGRAEADCTPPDCQWIAPTANAAGKTIKGYCRKQRAAKPS